MTETITADSLEGEQKEIAECIGIEAYRKISEQFGGSTIYIQKPDTLSKIKRNDEIRKLFNGKNYRSLALRFNLSENYIRLIVSHKNTTK